MLKLVCHTLIPISLRRRNLQALLHSITTTSDHHLSRLKSVGTSTYGVMFLGTPHQGVDIAKFAVQALRIQSLLRWSPANTRILTHLSRDSELLQDLLGRYTGISRNFETKFYYETRAMRIGGVEVEVNFLFFIAFKFPRFIKIASLSLNRAPLFQEWSTLNLSV